jgi:hypothetical protein
MAATTHARHTDLDDSLELQMVEELVMCVACRASLSTEAAVLEQYSMQGC